MKNNTLRLLSLSATCLLLSPFAMAQEPPRASSARRNNRRAAAGWVWRLPRR